MLLEPGKTCGMGDLAGTLGRGRRRNESLQNQGLAGRAPADVVQSGASTWRGEEPGSSEAGGREGSRVEVGEMD